MTMIQKGVSMRIKENKINCYDQISAGMDLYEKDILKLLTTCAAEDIFGNPVAPVWAHKAAKSILRKIGRRKRKA